MSSASAVCGGSTAPGSDVVARAIAIAERAHVGQVYPSPDREPFIEHPLRVMRAVDGPLAKAAAALHDVLEDSQVTAEDLRSARLPDEVVDAVIALTRTPGLSYEQYIEQVARNAIACEVKLADLNDNLVNNRRLAPSVDVRERIDRYERAIVKLSSVPLGPRH